MTFSAYFDESGTHGTSELLVFAGLIFFDQHDVEVLSQEWNRRLETFDKSLPYFHMVELNRRYLMSNSEEERQSLESLVCDLANIACEHASEGVINYVTTADFKALPQEARKRHKDAFYYAFEAGVLALAKASGNKSHYLQLICDDSDEHAAKCLEAFKRLKRIVAQVEQKLPMISFCDDRVHPPLQATDLFAYCWRANLDGSKPALWNKPLEIFKSALAESVRSEIRLSDGEVI